MDAWICNNQRGIVAVVTGGGKTFFALHCINHFQRQTPGATVLVVVPTEALLDQWYEELISFFDMPAKFVNFVNHKAGIKEGRFNIGVINSVAKVVDGLPFKVLLVVDECHRSASVTFRKIFNVPTSATLGLSATPERQYDDWYERFLIPALGHVIFRYTYKDALKDRVIVPFELKNILFQFNEEEQASYDKLTIGIRVCAKKQGLESQEAVRLLLKRARFSNSSPTRISIALKLIARHRNQKILVFHEDVKSCEFIHEVLLQNSVSSGVYHSAMSFQSRVKTLSDYRRGRINVLTSCRALDEGFNAPETEIGIIAAASAGYRQRVQRLGRILRPASNKEIAIIYSIVASPPEIKRLSDEASDLAEIAKVTWTRV